MIVKVQRRSLQYDTGVSLWLVVRLFERTHSFDVYVTRRPSPGGDETMKVWIYKLSTGKGKQLYVTSHHISTGCSRGRHCKLSFNKLVECSEYLEKLYWNRPLAQMDQDDGS